jgi:hypothetical protein
VAAGSLGIGAIAVAVATGAEISLMCSAVITLSLAATLKIRAIGRRVEPPLL